MLTFPTLTYKPSFVALPVLLTAIYRSARYTLPNLSIATTGSLLACHTAPSDVTSKPELLRGTKRCTQLPAPPFVVETTYLVVLKPPRSEKSLIAATKSFEFSGSTAMCSSASGLVVVGVTVGPTV